RLGRHAHGVDLGHLHLEDLLHGLLDFRLVGADVDFEHVLEPVGEFAGAFGNDRPLDDVAGVLHYANTSSTFATASFVMTSLSWFRRSSTLMPFAEMNFTPGMLRADSATLSSYSADTTRALRSTFRFFRICANSFVFGAAMRSSSRTTISLSRTLPDRADRMASRRTLRGSLNL